VKARRESERAARPSRLPKSAGIAPRSHCARPEETLATAREEADAAAEAHRRAQEALREV